MRRLTTRTIIMFIIFAAAISGSVVAGRRDSFAARLAILHLADCSLPCWINIVPGKTDTAEAVKRLKAVYSNVDDYTLVTISNSPPHAVLQKRHESVPGISPIWIAMGSGNGNPTRVTYILLNFSVDGSEDPLLLADLLNVLGVPDKVIVDNQGASRITLDYADTYHLQVEIHPTVDRLLLSQTVDSLVWYADTTLIPASNHKSQTWRGFTILGRYPIQ